MFGVSDDIEKLNLKKLPLKKLFLFSFQMSSEWKMDISMIRVMEFHSESGEIQWIFASQ